MGGRKIVIAQQGTLVNEIIPAQWVNDYKLHGENSFVFNTPELWEKMMLHPYSINDRRVNGDTLEYLFTVAGPTGASSFVNWTALLCELADAAADGIFDGIETAEQLAQSSAAMAAVANSETAMAAVANSETAMAAVANSETAMAAVTASETAMNGICSVYAAVETLMATPYYDEYIRENSMAIAKAAVALANSSEFSVISSCAEMAENSTAMSALAASETAMSALANSATGRTYISGSKYYNTYIKENTMCIAKMAVGFAGLDSAAYSSMAGVAAESTAMTAVAASSTAMTAVAASSTAMTAVAASMTALKAVVATQIARSAIESSPTAINALNGSSHKRTYKDPSDNWNTETFSGKGFLFKATDPKNAPAELTIDGGGVNKITSSTTFNKFYLSGLSFKTYYTNSTLEYLPIS